MPSSIDAVIHMTTLKGGSYLTGLLYILTDEKTEEREYRSLEAIRDNYPKYLLTLDSFTQQRNGIVHANLAEFIKDEKCF